MRGLDLEAFEDWMNDLSHREQAGVAPSTIFVPLHRVEKILLDENHGGVPSLAETFLEKVGAGIENYLE